MKKFEKKVWLSSPTMHGPEIEYVKEAYETNWMSTVGVLAFALKDVYLCKSIMRDFGTLWLIKMSA